MENIKLTPVKNITAFRKFGISSWKDSFDPNTSAILEVRMDNALRYIKQYRKQKKLPIIVLHLVIKAMADAMTKIPEGNTVLRFGRFYQRQGVTIGSTIASSIAGKEDGLCNIRMQDVETKTLTDVVKEANQRIKSARSESGDEDAYSVLANFPSVLLRPVLWLLHLLMFKFNLHLPMLKLERDPYGIVEITDIGALGVDNVILPLTPYASVPIVVGPGVIRDMPFVEDGQVVVRKGIRISLSMDHRYIDGFHGAKAMHTLKAYLENPFEHFETLKTNETNQS